MMDFFSIILPVGILVLCAYGVGYMSGSDAAREIYNPTIRKSDLDKSREIQYNRTMIITPNKFATLIESKVKEKRCGYMDAVLLYCNETGLDPSNIKSLVNKTLKEKIAYEAQSLNMLKEKTAKLPI